MFRNFLFSSRAKEQAQRFEQCKQFSVTGRFKEEDVDLLLNALDMLQLDQGYSQSYHNELKKRYPTCVFPNHDSAWRMFQAIMKQRVNSGEVTDATCQSACQLVGRSTDLVSELISCAFCTLRMRANWTSEVAAERARAFFDCIEVSREASVERVEKYAAEASAQVEARAHEQDEYRVDLQARVAAMQAIKDSQELRELHLTIEAQGRRSQQESHHLVDLEERIVQQEQALSSKNSAFAATLQNTLDEQDRAARRIADLQRTLAGVTSALDDTHAATREEQQELRNELQRVAATVGKLNKTHGSELQQIANAFQSDKDDLKQQLMIATNRITKLRQEVEEARTSATEAVAHVTRETARQGQALHASLDEKVDQRVQQAVQAAVDRFAIKQSQRLDQLCGAVEQMQKLQLQQQQQLQQQFSQQQQRARSPGATVPPLWEDGQRTSWNAQSSPQPRRNTDQNPFQSATMSTATTESLASVASVLQGQQQAEALNRRNYLDTHDSAPAWFPMAGDTGKLLREMDRMLLPQKDLDTKSGAAQLAAFQDFVARARKLLQDVRGCNNEQIVRYLQERAERAMQTFGWPNATLALDFQTLLESFLDCRGSSVLLGSALSTRIVLMEVLIATDKSKRAETLGWFLAGISLGRVGFFQNFHELKADHQRLIDCKNGLTIVANNYVLRSSFFVSSYSESAGRTAVPQASNEVGDVSSDSDVAESVVSSDQNSSDSSTSTTKSTQDQTPPQHEQAISPQPSSQVNAFIAKLKAHVQGVASRSCYVAVRWAHPATPRDAEVWVGRIHPLKRDPQHADVEYRYELAADGTIAPLLDDDGDPAALSNSLLADDVLIFALRIYTGAIPQGRPCPSRLSDDEMRKLFPEAVRTALAPVQAATAACANPCIVCHLSVTTDTICGGCEQPIHKKCARTGHCPRCKPVAAAPAAPVPRVTQSVAAGVSRAAPAPAPIDRPASKSAAVPALAVRAAPNLPLDDADEERDVAEEDNIEEILATQRGDGAPVVDDLPPRPGILGAIRKDRNDAEYSFISSALPPHNVFLHRRNAAGIAFTQGERVLFTPAGNPVRPGTYMAIAVRHDDEQDFRDGQPSPPLARVVKGADFVALILQQPCVEINEAVDLATQNARLRTARLVQDQIRALRFLQEAHFPIACIRALYKIKESKQWKWSTMQTAMGMLAGVLSCLDAYTHAHPVRLGEMGAWRMAVRRVGKKTHLEDVTQSAPATIADIRKAATALVAQPKAKLLLLLAWAHAARASNVMTLQRRCFDDTCRTITWRKAKTTAKRGPYSTHSTYGEFTAFVQATIKELPDTQEAMFTTDDLALVRKTLRSLKAAFDLRSFRRGALQALATQGVDEETLMQFSGHTTVRSLHRYLNWGQKFGAGHTRGTRAADNFLWAYAEFAGLLEGTVDSSSFPQHAKPVALLHLDALRSIKADNDDEWLRWSEWLSNPECYRGVQLTQIGRCNISSQHHDELLAKGFTEPLPESVQPRGGARVFHVPEWAKSRLRVITHTVDANQQQFPHLDLPYLHEVRASVHHGDYTICLDMASWFYQFPLAEGVRDFLVYQHEGKLYRWKRLGMGYRGACHIAQAALRRLAFRASKLVPSVILFIDNVKFSGSREQVLAAATAFVEDCIRVNATINEISITDWVENAKKGYVGQRANTATVQALISHRVTFLGVEADHEKKSTALGAKTRDKIVKVWAQRHSWTLHDFNAFISLMCFAMYATGRSLHPYFAALYVHRLAAHFGGVLMDQQLQKQFWRAPFDFLAPIHHNLQQWVDAALSTGDVAVPTIVNLKFDGVIIVDGCGDGYGIIQAHPDGSTSNFAGQWPEYIERSTTSEPLAVRQVPRHINIPQGTRWLLVLDHTPAVAAVNRGHGRSRDNNDMVHELALAFPGVAFKALHIPGWLMPADPISRNLPLQVGGLRHAVLQQLLQSVKTGETGMNFFTKKPICHGDLNRLDFNLQHSRDTQLVDAASWLRVPIHTAIRMAAIDEP